MKRKDVKILIADDNFSSVLNLYLGLTDWRGYSKPEVVNDGSQAVEKAKSYRPHVAILDTEMPVMDGLEACRRIRNINEGEDVLIFGSSKDPHYEQAWKDVGADGFFEKGEIVRHIIEKIERTLAEKGVTLED